jgi:hypothetical protein
MLGKVREAAAGEPAIDGLIALKKASGAARIALALVRTLGFDGAWSGGSNHEIEVTAVGVDGACATRSGGHHVCRDATFTLRRRGVGHLLKIITEGEGGSDTTARCIGQARE